MISQNIRRIAEEKRVTLKEIAEYTKVSQQGLNKMLKNDDFKSSTLIQISQLLDVDVSVFFQSAEKTNSLEVKQQKVVIQIELDERNGLRMSLGKDFIDLLKK